MGQKMEIVPWSALCRAPEESRLHFTDPDPRRTDSASLCYGWLHQLTLRDSIYCRATLITQYVRSPVKRVGE